MFTTDELASLVDAIGEDQTKKDAEKANQAAGNVGRAIWGYVHKGDFVGGDEFVPHPTDEEIASFVNESRKLASSLTFAGQALDQRNEIPVQGALYSAAALIGGRSGPSLFFGPAATAVDVRNQRRGAAVTGRFFELLNEREMEIEHYSWPYRIREGARGIPGVGPMHVAHKVFNDIAHDLETLGVLFEALADSFDNKHGGQTTPGPVLFATCIIAWLYGAGRLPSGHKSEAKKRTRASRPSLYVEMEKLVGQPTRSGGVKMPDGLSRDTFKKVLAWLKVPENEKIFRYEFRLPGLKGLKSDPEMM